MSIGMTSSPMLTYLMLTGQVLYMYTVALVIITIHVAPSILRQCVLVIITPRACARGKVIGRVVVVVVVVVVSTKIAISRDVGV